MGTKKTVTESMTEIASIQGQLNKAITNGQYSIQQIADRAGLTYADVFNFIETGKSSAMTRAKLSDIMSELELIETIDNVHSNLGDILKETIKLEEFMRIQGICRLCHEERELGVIIGNPGVGKTTALNEFVSRYHQDVILITARQEMSVKDFLNCIAVQLRVNISGSIYQMVTDLIRALKAHPKTLIIDESENMITHTVRKGEILREIFDEAKVGMILCGTFKLKSILVKGPTKMENLAQLYSRVTYNLEVGTMTESEVRGILVNYKVSEAAKREFIKVALDPNHGAIRMFVQSLRMCLKIISISGGEITREVFQEATKYLIFEN
jgi:DNA transposition AAA+ family ATPase